MAMQARSLVPVAQIALILASSVAVYSFVAAAREGEQRRRCTPLCLLRPNYAGADRRAPRFTLKDMKGKDVSLDAYAGKVVVLNFWTKTCNPCLEEMPDLVELAKVLKAQTDAVLLTVSTDDGPEAVRDVLLRAAREEPPFPVLFDPDAKIVRDKYGTRLFPETWVLDRRHVIRARFDGPRPWSGAAIVEFVRQLGDGSYCPLDVNAGKVSGEGAAVCASTPNAR